MVDVVPWTYLMDLNGVLMRDEEHVVEGAGEFLAALRSRGIPHLVFTNDSVETPHDQRARLLGCGLDVPEESIWTSALATAQFLDQQRPGGTAYVVGEAGLTAALTDVGYQLTDDAPDYVVLGETRTYSFAAITTAIRLVEGGARFLATNPDEKGPGREGSLPATGAVAALVERVTGQTPYYVGKPNPLMMRFALRALGAHSEHTIVLGDRMDTDIRCGMESGMQTILVLSGLSKADTATQFPYQPTKIIESVADIADHVDDPFPD
ncbi:HAD-IIA family hydrolase [Saccharopolyspora sp. NPDC000359]|uniref:HAD-IIA family hydrolase n=1 Tax=Saccharopolyspora sp. NPDC000359 TaxID=3154251 RepID=UPI003327F3CF